MKLFKLFSNFFKKCYTQPDDDLNEILINNTFNEVINNENESLDICTEILYENI